MSWQLTRLKIGRRRAGPGFAEKAVQSGALDQLRWRGRAHALRLGHIRLSQQDAADLGGRAKGRIAWVYSRRSRLAGPQGIRPPTHALGGQPPNPDDLR